jgi:hypothetical protein
MTEQKEKECTALSMKISDIVHRPVFGLKHNVSETAFCLHLQVEPIQLESISGDRN